MQINQTFTEKQVTKTIKVPSVQLTLSPREAVILARIFGSLNDCSAVELANRSTLNRISEELVTQGEMNRFLYPLYSRLYDCIKEIHYGDSASLLRETLKAE